MKKLISALIGVWFLVSLDPVEAQKVHRIGSLVATDQFIPAFNGFKKKMIELGYAEEKNITYEFYNANGDRDTLKAIAEKLVKDKHDVIVTSSTTATAPVAKVSAGTNVPVVFLSAGNPLEFVKSYAGHCVASSKWDQLRGSSPSHREGSKKTRPGSGGSGTQWL